MVPLSDLLDVVVLDVVVLDIGEGGPVRTQDVVGVHSLE